MATYDQLGKFYEMMYGNTVLGTELELYEKLARKTGSQVLEMGSGTGRVSIHLAAHDIEIHAVDISTEMIEIARTKADTQLGIEQKNNLTIIHGDMCTIDFDKSFGLAIFAFSPLRDVGSFERAQMALSNAFRLLKPNGILIIDNLYAGPGGPNRPNGMIRPVDTVAYEDEKQIKFSRTDWIQPELGITECWFYADIIDKRGVVVDRKTFYMPGIYILPERMKTLLEKACFCSTTIELFGSFDLITRIDDKSFLDPQNPNYQKARQVWICQKGE